MIQAVYITTWGDDQKQTSRLSFKILLLNPQSFVWKSGYLAIFEKLNFDKLSVKLHCFHHACLCYNIQAFHFISLARKLTTLSLEPGNSFNKLENNFKSSNILIGSNLDNIKKLSFYFRQIIVKAKCFLSKGIAVGKMRGCGYRILL